MYCAVVGCQGECPICKLRKARHTHLEWSHLCGTVFMNIRWEKWCQLPVGHDGRCRFGKKIPKA